MADIRIGTAGWTIPLANAGDFPGEGSHLERYGARLGCVEVNSSFHRPHRRSTYERWAASVGAEFRFAVKVPRTITHDARLVGCEALVERFAGEIAGLGDRLGPLLVQLPPSLGFVSEVAERFFAGLAAYSVVCEPRHASWFEAGAEALLERHRVARVAADPAKVAGAGEPGGWQGLAYFRWHGSPQIYRSAYGAEVLAAHAARIGASGIPSWTVFDNTASGAATGDALRLAASVARG